MSDESEYSPLVLRVDLSRAQSHVDRIPAGVARQFVGGSGLGSHILWNETGADTDPFAAENRLMFMIGPLTARVPMSSRYVVCGLSPANDAWGESLSGGTWPHALSRTGFSGIVFEGKADHPVYLYVEDDAIQIKDARHLWGQDTYAVSDLLRAETAPDACVAAIGRAGENKVRIAGVINDGRVGRAAARCGMGAVMGAKNLKAVVVKGSRQPSIYRRADLRASTRETSRRLAAIRRGEFGPMPHLSRAMPILQRMGLLMVKNFREGRFDAFVEKMKDFQYGEPYYCPMCPVGCGESHMGPHGRDTVVESYLPIGSNCQIEDLEANDEAYRLCNLYGMDSISVGVCLGFAMELYELGIISKGDMGGIDLRWGNAEAALAMIRQIGEAEGFGRLLGQGVKRAAEIIGGEAPRYAMHTKGLEMTLHDPRAENSLYIGYATAHRGGSHLDAHAHAIERLRLPGTTGYGPDASELGHPPGSLNRFGFRGKPDLVMKCENLVSMINSLVMCDFSYFYYAIRVGDLVHWLNCATGWDLSFEQLMENGERVWNLKRLINLRRGLSAKDDRLPERFFVRRPEVADGEYVPTQEEWQGQIQEYYALRAWTEQGVPSEAKLAALALSTPHGAVQ